MASEEVPPEEVPAEEAAGEGSTDRGLLDFLKFKKVRQRDRSRPVVPVFSEFLVWLWRGRGGVGGGWGG